VTSRNVAGFDVFGYNALTAAAAAAHASRPETPEELLRRMLQDGAQPDVKSSTSRPDFFSYNALISAAVARASRPETPEELLRGVLQVLTSSDTTR
jgi:hypothetical protein